MGEMYSNGINQPQCFRTRLTKKEKRFRTRLTKKEKRFRTFLTKKEIGVSLSSASISLFIVKLDKCLLTRL